MVYSVSVPSTCSAAQHLYTWLRWVSHRCHRSLSWKRQFSLCETEKLWKSRRSNAFAVWLSGGQNEFMTMSAIWKTNGMNPIASHHIITHTHRFSLSMVSMVSMALYTHTLYMYVSDIRRITVQRKWLWQRQLERRHRALAGYLCQNVLSCWEHIDVDVFLFNNEFQPFKFYSREVDTIFNSMLNVNLLVRW